MAYDVEDAAEGRACVRTPLSRGGYEDLLAKPRGGMAELFEWLSLDMTEDAWQQLLMEGASEFNVDPGSPGVRADKWREEWSRQDMLSFEAIAGPLLRDLGYGQIAPPDGEPVAHRLRSSPVVGALKGARHPRAMLRTTVRKAYAREALRLTEANHGIVEKFERSLAARDLDVIRDMLASNVLVRVVGVDGFDGRGPEAAETLIGLVEEHAGQELQVQTGSIHASSGSFTNVVTYRLADGTYWIRTFVIDVRHSEITALVMYRFLLDSGTISERQPEVDTSRRTLGQASSG